MKSRKQIARVAKGSFLERKLPLIMSFFVNPSSFFCNYGEEMEIEGFYFGEVDYSVYKCPRCGIFYPPIN